jgi:MFS transporter, PPP family, 3-phenylpropionic acid transporter
VLVGVADATILPFIPLLLRERGFGSADIGLLLAGMALAGFATGPLWGYAADLRVGSEVVLAATCAAAGFGSVLVFFARDRTLLAVAVVALWACRSSSASLADAIALDRLGAERRAEYGRVRLWTSIGWAAAVLVWGAIVEASAYGTAALLYPVALLGVVGWTLFGLGGRSAAVVRHATRAPLRHVVRPLVVFLTALLLAQTAFAAGFNFSSLRIAGLGGSALLVAVAASLQAWAEVPAMAWMTRMRGVVAARHFYVAGCGVYAAVLLFWAVATSPVSVAVARLVLGVGFALTYVGSVVVVDELVPSRLRATGQVAAKSVTFGLAPVAGALGGGLVYGHVSARAMFLAAGVCAALAGLVAAQASASRPATYHSSSGSKIS